MKKRFFAALLALALSLSAVGALAEAWAYYGTSYEGLLGSMEIVNCKSWASLRAYPDTKSQLLARVPLGDVVTSCYYEDEWFTYCVYDGMEGYILNSNLSFIMGPAGYEYTQEEYLGNMQIVNCISYATLRTYPDTRSQQVIRVPLDAVVTNCFYEDDRFCYCMYGNYEGYILSSNLSPMAGSPTFD